MLAPQMNEDKEENPLTTLTRSLVDAGSILSMGREGRPLRAHVLVGKMTTCRMDKEKTLMAVACKSLKTLLRLTK